MYVKYSLGFLVASLVQAGIIWITETLGLSTLDAKFTLSQLLVHVIAGQIAGYILLFAYRNMSALQQYSTLFVGLIYGLIVWAILIPINSVVLNDINAPWTQGIATLISSLIAFIVFGIIAFKTIKNHGYSHAKLK